MEPLLRAVNLTKRFGGLVAVDSVSFDVRPGEVIGLVGDNGAGKSTFIKMISGVYQPDGGEIYFDGQKVSFIDPRDARDLGIETIYQDLALAENLDVGSNIFLGREIKKRFISVTHSQIISSIVFALPLGALLAWTGLQFYKIFGLALGLVSGLAFGVVLGWLFGPVTQLVDRQTMMGESAKALKRLDIEIPSLTQQVRNLSGGQRQSVAIARSIYWNAKVMIMDEPTAALGVSEQRKVLTLVRTLAGQGVPVIIISHNMQDVFAVADRIVILRRGKKVGEQVAAETTPDKIVSLMVGAETVHKMGVIPKVLESNSGGEA
ncbi:MAG: sugar ABC transporter ATP-binding protein [Chloroflexi bacterium]|jgi:ABC-type sugar transport system ATPase subunit|nr:sugar ABC transporter ATP-binding protein [Chloroflexota bacterium]